jgi:hypothetical protein
MLQCAKDLQTNLEGAYTGKTANSAVTISVPGSTTMPGSNPPSAGTKFNFTCNGVNGCVTVMQNLATNLKTETQNQDKAKKNYIQNANQQLEQYKQQLENILTIQNNALDQRLSQLKSKLPSLGVTDPLQVQRLQKVGMTKSKTKDAAGNEYDGLYNTPDDLLGVLGGDIGMIDPNSSTFDSARAAIANAMSEDRHRDSEIASSLVSLKTAEAQCLKDARLKVAEKYVGQSEAVVTCAKIPSWCGGSAGKVNELLQIIGDISADEKNLALQQIEGNLSSGTAQCGETKRRQDYLENRQKEIEDELKACADASCRAIVQQSRASVDNELASLRSSEGQQKNCSGLTARLKPAIQELKDGSGGGDTDAKTFD